jgi:nitronate monooxygenase
VALDEAGIDIVVASGAEAGGHRGAFLARAEDSLVGTLPLVRIAVEEVRAPVIAAGGIAEARGIAAALALGAEGVQIGTAFLATDESGATAEHRAALLGGRARRTMLTRAFSGRLARGIPNHLVERLTAEGAIEPYPYQSYLLGPVVAAARAQGRTDVVAMWSGQATPLLEHRSAAALYAALSDGTEQLLTADPTITTGASQ